MKSKVLCVVVFLAVACNGGHQKTVPENGTVVVGMQSLTVNMNPYLDDSATGVFIHNLLYPSLLTEQPDYEERPPTYLPNLAESYEISEDGMSVVFRLRKNARWSDGRPLTAEDVLFTYRTQTSEEAGWIYRYVKEGIDGVVRIDNHTVRFDLNRPNPYILMDINDGQIIPAVWAAIPYDKWQDISWEDHAVSAGPFKLVRYLHNQSMDLDTNTAYWDWPKKPFLNRLVLSEVSYEDGLVNQLLVGDLAAAFSLNPEQFKRVVKNQDIRLERYRSRKYIYLGFNLERAMTADREFRRLVAHSIDLDCIMAFRYTFATPMNGPILPSMWGSLKDLPKNSFNTAVARSILDSLGWKVNPETKVREQDGKELKMELLTVNSQNAMDLCHLIARDLERVGIKVDIRTFEFGTYWATLKEGDFDLFIGAENAPTQIDFDNFETPSEGMEGYNFTRYSNPEVDRLIEATHRATTFEELLPLYEELQRVIVADQPVIWLYQEVSVAGITNYLHDVEVNAADPFYNIADWWTETCTRKPDARKGQ